MTDSKRIRMNTGNFYDNDVMYVYVLTDINIKIISKETFLPLHWSNIDNLLGFDHSLSMTIFFFNIVHFLKQVNPN